MASDFEVQIDDDLTKLEDHAEKNLIEGASKIVARQSKEIDFLAMVEEIKGHLQGVVMNEDRSQLLAIFASPYIRIYRIRYLLDTVPLSEKRVSDPRWVTLRKLAVVVESVLRDIDGPKFRPWQEVTDFTPAFVGLDDLPEADDMAVEAKTEEAEDASPSLAADKNEVAWLVENSFELCLKGGESMFDGKAPLLPLDEVQSVTTAVSLLNKGTLTCDADYCVTFSSRQQKYYVLYKTGTQLIASLVFKGERFAASSLHFADCPRGGHAIFRCDNLALSRNAECGFWAQNVDNAADMAGASGVDESTTEAVLTRAPESVSKVSDDGGTAISKIPVKRFPGVGQYVEIVVTGLTDSTVGCCGIGVTTLPPRCFSIQDKFPRRLEFYQGQSWIFSGPYKGITQRLYVHGKKEMTFIPENRHKRLRVGDRLGVLVLPGGRISLYRNRQLMVTSNAPGLEDEEIMEKDLYLVVEVYGYVTTVFLDNEATPEGLQVEGDTT